MAQDGDDLNDIEAGDEDPRPNDPNAASVSDGTGNANRALDRIAQTSTSFSHIVEESGISAIGAKLAESCAQTSKPLESISECISRLPDYPAPAIPSIVVPRIELPSVPAFRMPDDLISEISRTASHFSEQVSRSFAGLSGLAVLTPTIQEPVHSALESIRKALSYYDTNGYWARLEEAASHWGSHGWVMLDDFPNGILFAWPDAYGEANRIGRRYASRQFEALREALPVKARKRRDVEEMFELYDQGHLKSCAMMACALIDGELYNWKIAKTHDRKVRSNPKGLSVAGDARSAQFDAVSLVAVICAYQHFFQQGRGFDRSIEGELNRNFLVHGMMNKRVSRVACMKLILLLGEIVRLLPYCEMTEQTPNA